MSYRNITVDDVKYQYITGKTHTKVKGIGVVENTRIGEYEWQGISSCYKNCSCGPKGYYLQLRVKPKHVAEMIAIVKEYGKDILKTFSIVQPPKGYELNKEYKSSEMIKRDDYESEDTI